MKKGRITQEEQTYRIGMLLRFIFIFRYVTREQLLQFGKDRLKLSHQRWLIDYSVKRGFIATYHEQILMHKVYYLTARGKAFISKYESFIRHYRFDHTNTGFNTFAHQKAVVESYFYLYKHLDIKEWIPEWVIKKDHWATDKIPDGVIVTSSGLKIALEVETWYKKRGTWKTVVYRYNREMSSSAPRYDVVLIVASNSCYDGIKNRLFYIDREFIKKAFIISSFFMLDIDRCFYQDEYMSLKEAVGLIYDRKSVVKAAS